MLVERVVVDVSLLFPISYKLANFYILGLS